MNEQEIEAEVERRVADRLAAHPPEPEARLLRWKAEAMEVLAEWERVYAALGNPGRLGESKAAAALAEVEDLRRENAALHVKVAALQRIADEYADFTGRA